MQHQKTLSFLVLACFLLVGVHPASAQEKAMDQDLTQAILQVKTTLGIDTDLWDDFDYYATERDQGNRWSLNWSSTTDPEQDLSVEADQLGNIYRYDLSIGAERHGLGALSEVQGLETSRQFIQKVAPALLLQLVPLATGDNNHTRSAFNYVFNQQIDGIPIKDAQVSVWVDKYSGQVTTYQLSGTVDLTKAIYPAKGQAIPLTTAQKTYLAQCGLELIYRSNYDYQDKTLSIFPVYQLKQSSLAIDAQTGKVVSYHDFRAMGGNESTGAGPAADKASGRGGSLSLEEQKAVDGLGKLITKEAAQVVLAESLGLDLTGYTLTDASLNKMPMDNEHYMWALGLSKPLNEGASATIYGTVNAGTSQVLSFYRQDESQAALGTKENQATAEKKVTTFLNKVAKDQLAASQLTVADQNRPSPISSREQEDYGYFNYQRLVKGIPFPDNGLRVIYDYNLGAITSYNCTWYNNATFPDLSKAQSADWMMDTISKQANFTLQYVNGLEANAMIYDFTNKRLTNFDPFTGQALDWQGKPVQEQALPSYQGLDSSPWAKSAQVLLDNGIYLDKAQLEPGRAISQQDFLTLLARVDQPYLALSDQEYLLGVLTSKGVLAKGDALTDQPLTRAQGAKYVVKYLGYEPLALWPQAFVYPYTDAVQAEDKGYVAIAATLGLLTADSKNQLSPTAPLSLGESFLMIHQVAK